MTDRDRIAEALFVGGLNVPGETVSDMDAHIEWCYVQADAFLAARPKDEETDRDYLSDKVVALEASNKRLAKDNTDLRIELASEDTIHAETLEAELKEIIGYHADYAQMKRERDEARAKNGMLLSEFSRSNGILARTFGVFGTETAADTARRVVALRKEDKATIASLRTHLRNIIDEATDDPLKT